MKKTLQHNYNTYEMANLWFLTGQQLAHFGGNFDKTLSLFDFDWSQVWMTKLNRSASVSRLTFPVVQNVHASALSLELALRRASLIASKTGQFVELAVDCVFERQVHHGVLKIANLAIVLDI